jgi:hypothetical protein
MLRKYSKASNSILKVLQRSLSSQTANKLSYYHRSEGESFKYITVGKLLQNAAENYGEKISLITYSEKKRISFAETLEKVVRGLSS